jgi:outer membrane receptor protein involved in Fe transport
MASRMAIVGCAALALLTAGRALAQADGAATGDGVRGSADPAPTDYRAIATASRSPRAPDDVTASTHTITRAEIDRSATLTTDALLRAIPSVATFRRSYSLVADPTSQGLNLRGLGPSGASRTLVLVDGVPANDPFGGWVYFRALPRLGIERVEIVHGGASALYGNAALGGVVQIFTRSAWQQGVDADVAFGSLATRTLSARGAAPVGRFAGALELDLLRSDGYPVVALDRRGVIDRNASSEHGNLRARFELNASDRLKLTSTLGFFRELQAGGTRFTTAQVDQGTAAISAELDAEQRGVFTASFFTRVQGFEQQRARIAPERVSETRSALQHVPSEDQGGALVWTSPTLTLAGQHVLSAGVDVRRVEGEAREQIFAAPPADSAAVTLRRRAGGEQLLAGVFVQDAYSPTDWLLIDASARADAVRDSDGHRMLEPADAEPIELSFADRTVSAFSPRLGARVRVVDALLVRGSIYRAFRAPTLNELYRPFQVGTVLTAANAELQPEQLSGAELGVELTVVDALRVRATGFWNVLDEPITNVTLAAPLPDGAQRQRQNLGSARVRGAELELLIQPTRSVALELAYTLAESRVVSAGAMAELEGKQLAQDPVHRASAQLAVDASERTRAGVQLRVIGPQYEDDQNELRMDGYAVIDASLGLRIAGPLEIFAAVENLLDTSYLVGRAGVDTIGQPLMARMGMRLRDL